MLNDNEKFERRKARLVSNGLPKNPHVDNFEVYSPVMRYSMIRILNERSVHFYCKRIYFVEEGDSKRTSRNIYVV